MASLSRASPSPPSVPGARLAIVTTFFPNAALPHRAPFLSNLASALSGRCEVRVVAPLPWAPPLRHVRRWHELGRVAPVEEHRGLTVRHPRFLVVPKVPWFSGLAYGYAILPVLRSLAGGGPIVLHGHCLYPDGAGVAFAARRLGWPYLLTAHGSDVNVYARRPLIRTQIGRALRGARGVVAVSSPIQRVLREMLGPAAPPIEHIPCAGFDAGSFGRERRAEARGALGLGPAGRLVLFVGNLVPIKATDRLVEAWGILSRSGALGDHDRLAVVGEGRCRGDLERQTARLGLGGSVRFEGAIPPERVPRWLSAADLLCLVSRNEGTPNVIVEALASGRPVVATPVGGVADLIEHGRNGLLAEAAPEALASAIQVALGRDWDEAALRSSVSAFTWDNLADRNLRFMERCLGDRC
jgi:teichuronic acid biosynthesis glycosyltransferase TuaC